MNFGNIFVGQLVKHWRFSLSDSIKSQVQTKIIFFKQIAFFIDPNGRGTFVWFGLYSVNVHRNRLFYVFDHKWLVNIFFFQFRKFCKKMCQKLYVRLACDAKATPQILNCDRKMLLVSGSTTWIFFKISSNRKRLPDRTMTQNNSTITERPIRNL